MARSSAACWASTETGGQDVALPSQPPDAFPGSLDLDRLAERFADLARRYASIRQDLGETLDDPAALRRPGAVVNLRQAQPPGGGAPRTASAGIVSNPIAAWTGGAGTGGVSYFAFDGQALATSLSLPPQLRETGQDMVRELVDWRLTEYLPAVSCTHGTRRGD